jgi:transposase
VTENNQFFLLCAHAHKRKNWMFSNIQEGAKASAMLYSIIETAKSNNLNPHAYLQLLFTKMPQVKSIEEYEQLLP